MHKSIVFHEELFLWRTIATTISNVSMFPIVCACQNISECSLQMEIIYKSFSHTTRTTAHGVIMWCVLLSPWTQHYYCPICPVYCILVLYFRSFWVETVAVSYSELVCLYSGWLTARRCLAHCYRCVRRPARLWHMLVRLGTLRCLLLSCLSCL